MIAARIAYDILERESPETLRIAEDILRNYQNSYTQSEEGEHPFVESVTFADAMKYKGWYFQSKWHYDGRPVFADGTDESDYRLRDFPLNITAVLPDLYSWLKGDKNVSDTKTFQKIMSKVDTIEEGKSVALRLLIHLIEDVHQPCHSVARYSP